MVNEPDLMPLDPKKKKRYKRMKMSTCLFLRKTNWDRYARFTVPYLEESEKEIFAH